MVIIRDEANSPSFSMRCSHTNIVAKINNLRQKRLLKQRILQRQKKTQLLDFKTNKSGLTAASSHHEANCMKNIGGIFAKNNSNKGAIDKMVANWTRGWILGKLTFTVCRWGHVVIQEAGYRVCTRGHFISMRKWRWRKIKKNLNQINSSAGNGWRNGTTSSSNAPHRVR